MKEISSARCFDGRQLVFAHQSEACASQMRFAVFLPPERHHGPGPYPVLYWLSGLTCTEENFITKSGFQRIASELGLLVVAPDTSPRGDGVPDDPEGAYDFGLGAGFYVNATQEPWADHYNMYDYITEELPALIEKSFPADSHRAGVFGHSMGGHGALIVHLRNQKKFRSCSALAPIAAPSDAPWGEKAFGGYLGPDRTAWAAYDATRLLLDHGSSDAHILIDQGAVDQFLSEQLLPEKFKAAAADTGQALTLRMQDGYDHSYYFIATFIEDHLRWHHRQLTE